MTAEKALAAVVVAAERVTDLLKHPEKTTRLSMTQAERALIRAIDDLHSAEKAA